MQNSKFKIIFTRSLPLKGAPNFAENNDIRYNG